MTLYKKAGVDLDAAKEFVEKIKPIASTTGKRGAISTLGGFGAVLDLKAAGFKDPLMVTGTDGVGSKLKLANKLGYHSHVGIDLVAMSANDVLCHGAKPLYFLDYYAVGKLDPVKGAEVIQGIANGCIRAGCSLVGGETAELPSMYKKDELELAGFCIGAVERENLLPSNIEYGDMILGIASSGLHANGYSMIKSTDGFNAEQIKEIMEPTLNYARACYPIMNKLKGLAHITGGGIIENLPRIIPDGLSANICIDWQPSELYRWIMDGGITKGKKIPFEEMLNTFNCGVGMAIVLDRQHRVDVWNHLHSFGHTVFEIGRIDNERDDGCGKIRIFGGWK